MREYKLVVLGAGGVGKGSPPAEVPEKHPRSEEAEAQEAERSQDQTCRYSKDSEIAKTMHKMIPLKGWFHTPYMYCTRGFVARRRRL